MNASGGQSSAARPRPATALRDVIARASEEFEAMTGRRVDSVSGLHRSDDGWDLTIEVVELERIPASTSVLGTYEATLLDDGSLAEFERVRRYYRNQASDGDA